MAIQKHLKIICIQYFYIYINESKLFYNYFSVFSCSDKATKVELLSRPILSPTIWMGDITIAESGSNACSASIRSISERVNLRLTYLALSGARVLNSLATNSPKREYSSCSFISTSALSAASLNVELPDDGVGDGIGDDVKREVAVRFRLWPTTTAGGPDATGKSSKTNISVLAEA